MNRREFKLTYTTTNQFSVGAKAQASAILNILPWTEHGTFAIELLSEQAMPSPGSAWLSKSRGFHGDCPVHAYVFEVLNNQVFFRYEDKGEWFSHKVGVPWFLENYTPVAE